ncbi:AI-2E family transporter [Actimicrobium antarcticum]|uniref:AI-2E family transporter n=1 Tax=Actimicrobium antarcticum TaxID=1051899 RepID=A0ABP7SW45_9BURK
MTHSELNQKAFLLLLAIVTVAFGWILVPFIGAVFWGAVLALLFAPLNRRLLDRFGQRQTLAALATLMIVLFIVILPLSLIGISLIQEGALVVQKIRSGTLDFGAYFQQVVNVLPTWLVSLLSRFGLDNFNEMQTTLSTALRQGSQTIATQVLSITQNTFDFVVGFGLMLYLLFFLTRDGAALSARIKHAIPLEREQKKQLFAKFTTVIRATVKGNIAVAASQGALGGMMFAFLGIQGAVLWGVLMAVLSLLPAIGAALIWGPVALYFLLTGAIWQGITLVAFGVLVIGLVDNILRPLLVGKDTQMPDYVVLISTVGGISVFGLSGFVIGPAIAAMFMAAWTLFSREKDLTKG